MNHISDSGIIISTRAHGENGAVIHVLSENHGKCGGYVNGAQSSQRLRSSLQQGNIISFDWQSKSDGQLGRFDVELERDIAVMVMDDAKALAAVQSMCGLMDMFLPEREVHPALFHGTCAVLGMMGQADTWPPAYIMWEMAFLKELGYGIDISKCTVTGATENLTHVSPKTGRAVCAAKAAPYASKLLEIPQFMQGRGFASDDFEKGLALTGHFLMHRLLQQSSYHGLPDARSVLVSQKPR